MFSDGTKVISRLWNHWKGTEWSLKTKRSLEGTGHGKGEVVPMVWSTGLFMKIFQLLNYCICLFRFHSFGGVLKFAISIHNWILNIILVMLMWLHLTWLAKEFCDSVRHLAWNGNMWKGPQKHNRPVTCLAYFINFPLCSFTNWKETNMPVSFYMHSLHITNPRKKIWSVTAYPIRTLLISYLTNL